MRINEPLEIDVYKGCRFQARCPYAIEKCKEEPPLEKIDDGRKVACFVKLD
ncbi:MAG TPA: oligopeptide/dipeptide ABC transporter ATP-binding protein [Nitrosopumilaceae archaeon]|nr:oligopeptide/dipeptide ABC transporter ATP-binding protein [Nitrosopumilaceae archaeon]